MIENDKQRFTKVLKAFLYTMNGTHSPDVAVLGHYWDALKGQEIEKVEQTLNVLAAESSEHVKPADVLTKITGKKQHSGKQDFNMLLNLVSVHGVNGAREHVDKEGKAFKCLNKIGGLASLNTSDVSRIRSEFYRVYDDLR